MEPARYDTGWSFTSWIKKSSITSLSDSFPLVVSAWHTKTAKQARLLFRKHFPRKFVPVLIVLHSATIVVLVIFQAANDQCTDVTWQVGAPYTCPQPLLTGPTAAVLLYFGIDHGQSVAWYMLLLWVSALARTYEIWACCTECDMSAEIAHRINLFSYPTSQLLFFFLVYRRVKVLERAMMENLGLWIMRLLVYASMVPGAIGIFLVVFFKHNLRAGIGVMFWACTFLTLSFMAATVRALCKSARFAWDLLQNRPGKLETDARQGIWAVRGQVLGLLVTGLTTGAVVVNYALYKGYMWPVPALLDMFPDFFSTKHKEFQFIYFPSLVDSIANSVGALLFAGVFSGGIRMGASRRRKDVHARQLKRMQLMYEYDSFSNDPSWHEAWHEKVLELAHRSITLEVLLDFYSELSVHMPHYNPTLHTTTDVVRQAIIPLTANAGTALATILMNGAKIKPRYIVTHNWRNLFRDLVGAIVADALQEDCFKNVTFFLDNSVPTLKEWAASAGALHNTYWICAFSVNQHVSICADIQPHERDPVLFLEHPACQCGRTKYYNGTAPTTDTGQSVLCEMNKFDDMMRYLAAKDKDFSQVVAVDQKFELFTRAWCMAELVEAYKSGISSRLSLFSKRELKRHERRLRNLQVESMAATRPEDVHEILAKIPDKQKFNIKLRHLIFDRLIADVRFLDAAEQMRHVGRLARWEGAMQRLQMRPTPTQSTHSTQPSSKSTLASSAESFLLPKSPDRYASSSAPSLKTPGTSSSDIDMQQTTAPSHMHQTTDLSITSPAASPHLSHPGERTSNKFSL